MKRTENHLATPGKSHHNPIVAQLNQRIRKLEKKEAPSDHVEATGQNALDLINGIATGLFANEMPHAGKQLRDAAFQLEKLLSRRSTSPATVSASPDSAPWTVMSATKDFGQAIGVKAGWAIFEGEKEICFDSNLDSKSFYEQIARHRNATLPAPRIGSEVSGPRTLDAKWLDPECWDGCQSLVYKHRCEKYEALLHRVLEWCDSDAPNFEIDADTIRAAINSTTPPAPSAPSSTEQKGA